MATFGLIEYQDASNEVRAIYDDIMATRKTDWINNFWKAIAHDPVLLKRTWESIKQIMAPGALDPLTKEMLYIAGSVTNNCNYCLASHTASARVQGITPAMPPTAKDAENLAAKPDGAARAASGSALPADSAIKQQPVALEVPVSVNGARAVDGSDKREPFSESTKTVLIFGSGAVIRLSSSVAPGQLLFLTNEKTKKEVVCQVVKSKNYRNVNGYVELEFTESVVGFWGMRFPGDRIGSAPQQVTPAPPVSVTPSVLPAKPVVPVSAVAVKDAAPKPSETKTVIPAVTKPEDLLPQKPVAPVAPLSSTLSLSFDPEAPLSVRTTPPPPPVVPVVLAVPVS